MKTLAEQIVVAKREVAMRKQFYPGLINRGKMTADEVRHQIECMEAIVSTLEMCEVAASEGGGSLL